MRILFLLATLCSLFASPAFAQNPPVGGNGTVTAVGLSMPSMFAVTGSPVNTSGTLAATLASQSPNLVFASPNASSGSPVFRTLLNADIDAGAAIAGSKLGAASVPNSVLANMAVLTLKSNIGGSPNIPADNTMTAILDAIFGTTRGQILFRGASAWTALAPGATGTFLAGNGAGADPTYAIVPPTGLGSIGAGTVLGNPSGVTAPPTASSLTTFIDQIGNVQGDVLYRNATGWTVLGPVQPGSLLQSGGGAANLAWSTPGQIKGDPSQSNALAGNVGEFLTQTTMGTAVSGGGVTTTCTQLTLGGGDWDIFGNIEGHNTASTMTDMNGSSSLTTNVSGGFPFNASINGTSSTSDALMTLPPRRISIVNPGTATIYIVGAIGYVSGTSTLDCYIRARRMR